MMPTSFTFRNAVKLGPSAAGVLLMEPGPTQVDERVVRAIGQPPVHHLSQDFIDYMDATCAALAGIYGTMGEVVIIPSSGRGGIEAVLGSLDLQNRAVLIVSNGSFGTMMSGIAKSLGLRTIDLNVPVGEIIPRADIEAALQKHSIGLVGIVQCESSTGMVNDLMGLSELAHKAGALLLVDAISSLGGVPLDAETLGVDFCVAAPQKALGAFCGLAMISVSEAGASAITTRPVGTEAGAFYFDLKRWWDIWLPEDRGGLLKSGKRRLPHSMPTNLVYALGTACRLILEEETVAKRLLRHEAAGRAFRRGLRALGLRTLPDEDACSATVTAFLPPSGVDSTRLIAQLDNSFGIRVAGGLDELRGKLVRVGHMAETARPMPLLYTLAAIAGVLGPTTERDSAVDVFLHEWNSANHPAVGRP